ncbi:MAG: nuclear transport factor 2 family protein [Pseudomonadota bacterium]
MRIIQSTKETVRRFTSVFDDGSDKDLSRIASDHLSSDFLWRGMYPFYEVSGPEGVVESFWLPLRKSLHSLQRREDIFFAGLNDVDGGQSTWTCSMGHFMGLFDTDFLGIPKTGRLASLRYAEFMRVDGDQILESAFFFDLIGLMQQAGVYPLPPMTGNYFVYPGPLTHDGQQVDECDPRETTKTIALVNEMIEDLRSINHLDDEPCPPDLLRRTWHEDMLWYGPSGIGATYTIPRYQKQHQFPFRMNVTEKVYNGHVARIAEGNYCGFFGWANLTNRNRGGFLGLPAAREPSDMRIVDIYRRQDDKLAENWVFIDIPHYLNQQGLDVLARLRELGST